MQCHIHNKFPPYAFLLSSFAVALMDALFFFSIQNKSSTTEYVPHVHYHILGMITYLNKSIHTYINDMMQNLSMFNNMAKSKKQTLTCFSEIDS